MKNYIISRVRDGILLTCESLDKQGRVVKFVPNGQFDIGNDSAGSRALALAIMNHYFDAKPTDPAATAEATRQVTVFLDAFLVHHPLPSGAKLEISSDVIDASFRLRQNLVLQ